MIEYFLPFSFLLIYQLQSFGMYMLMKPPKLAPSQYFRQSKLTHCLKDVVSGNTMVRIILTVRPERDFLQSTLEAMRFASRARFIPIDMPRREGCIDNLSFQDKVAHMCNEMGIRNPNNDHGGEEEASLGLESLNHG